MGGCGDTPAHMYGFKLRLGFIHMGMYLIAQERHRYDMKITIKIKSVYGNELRYVVEPEPAAYIRTLTGKKTVDEQDIRALMGLGIEVYYVG